MEDVDSACSLNALHCWPVLVLALCRFLCCIITGGKEACLQDGSVSCVAKTVEPMSVCQVYTVAGVEDLYATSIRVCSDEV